MARSMSKKLRFEVFKRDSFVCQYCGATPPAVVLEVDHIHPVAKGGDNGIDNLITACFDCNRGKSARLLATAPQSLKDKAKEVQERESQLRGYHEIMEAKRNRIDDEMWQVANELIPNSGIDGMRRDWLLSIKNFVNRIGVHEVLDAAEIARANKPYSDSKRFLYFCGICWNKVRDENGSR